MLDWSCIRHVAAWLIAAHAAAACIMLRLHCLHQNNSRVFFAAVQHPHQVLLRQEPAAQQDHPAGVQYLLLGSLTMSAYGVCKCRCAQCTQVPMRIHLGFDKLIDAACCRRFQRLLPPLLRRLAALCRPLRPPRGGSPCLATSSASTSHPPWFAPPAHTAEPFAHHELSKCSDENVMCQGIF